MNYTARIEKWIGSIPENQACLIEAPDDLFYLTGLSLSTGSLLGSKQGAHLFVDGRYYGKAKQTSPCPVSLSSESSLKSAFQHFPKIHFDSSFTTYQKFTSLQTRFPKIEWVPIPGPIKPLRLYKDADEIALLKKAAHLTYEGYQHILKILKEGITELDAALEFEFFCRKKGASGFSFESIIAFGENSAYPHYRAGNAKLQKNQIVLIDVGAIIGHYCGDMTRVFFFGEPPPELARFYQIVTHAQRKAIAHIKPGIKLGELDRIVRDEFKKEQVEELYTHTLGHGIGLETHEYPRIKWDGEDKDLILQPGMVFTVEPGLYKPGLGGIRYEDTLLVTSTGSENFYPKR